MNVERLALATVLEYPAYRSGRGASAIKCLRPARNTLDSARIPRASKLLICGLFQKGRVLAQDGDHAGMISSFVRALVSAFKARRELALENVAFRQQLAVLRRSVKRPRLSNVDREFWVLYPTASGQFAAAPTRRQSRWPEPPKMPAQAPNLLALFPRQSSAQPTGRRSRSPSGAPSWRGSSSWRGRAAARAEVIPWRQEGMSRPLLNLVG